MDRLNRFVPKMNAISLKFNFKLILFCLILGTYKWSHSQDYKIRIVNELSEEVNDVQIFSDSLLVAISDDQGVFNIDSSNKFKMFEIKHLSYITKRVSINSDTTFVLHSLKNELDEIVISQYNKLKRLMPQKSLMSRIGFFKGYKAFPNRRYATFIENKKKDNAIINSILVETSKGYYSRKKGLSLPFRINIYSKKPDSLIPDEPLLSQAIMINSDHKKNKFLEIDVSDLSISFPKNGIFVVVETLSALEYRMFREKNMQFPIFKILKRNDKKNVFTLVSFDKGRFQKLDFAFNFGVSILY